MRSFSILVLFAIVLSFGAALAEDTLELTEVGIELATKAAEIYAEEIYPGSSLGPAEPVYNLTLDGSITGWYFFVDTTGVTEPNKDDIYAAIDVWLPLVDTDVPLTGEEYEKGLELAKVFYNRYKYLHIANAQECTPLIQAGRVTYPFTYDHRKELAAEGKEIQDTTLLSNVFRKNIYIAYKCTNSIVYYKNSMEGRIPDGVIAELVRTPSISSTYIYSSHCKWSAIIEDRIEDLREIDEKLQPYYIHN